MFAKRRKYVCIIVLFFVILFTGFIVVNIQLNKCLELDKCVECFSNSTLSENQKNNFKIYFSHKPFSLKIQFKNDYIDINKNETNNLFSFISARIDTIIDAGKIKFDDFINIISYNLVKTIDKLRECCDII